MTPEEEAQLAEIWRVMEASSMPSDLETKLADWIVPQTLNASLKHGEVMICIELAYPVILDYLREHPDALRQGETL